MPARRIELWSTLPLFVALGGTAAAGDFVKTTPTAIDQRYVYSPNGRFVLEVNATEEGSAVRAAADPARTLWTLRGRLTYVWSYILLSDDGEAVALVRDGSEDRTVEGLRIVNRDRVVATYRIDELTELPMFGVVGQPITCRPPTPPWAYGVSNEGDRFVLQTTDGKNHRFHFTGEPAPQPYFRRLGLVVAGALVGGIVFLVTRCWRSPAPPAESGANE